MNYKLKMTKAKVLASIKKYVTYISLLFEKVQFSLEDATRTKKNIFTGSHSNSCCCWS